MFSIFPTMFRWCWSGAWHKQVSQACISNCISQNTVGCNYHPCLRYLLLAPKSSNDAAEVAEAQSIVFLLSVETNCIQRRTFYDYACPRINARPIDTSHCGTKAACFAIITETSAWVRWRLKSQASRLCTQPFVQALIKENIKTPRHWS